MRRYFPADVVCTGKGQPLGCDCSRGAFDYTYLDSSYPYYVVPPRMRKQELCDHFLVSGKRQGGDLWLSTEPTPDSMQARIRVSVPGGGVVLQSDPGTVIAPESGYQDVLEVTLAFSRPGRNRWDQPEVRFFARQERNGEVLYSLYELVGGRIFIGGGQAGFYPHLVQRTNPYGSRNLELSDENQTFIDREWEAREALRRRIEETEKAQGEQAAHDCWSKGWDAIHARQAREHQERQARSPRILAEALELEKRRLEYAPIMSTVLAGQPHPPWPRAGIKGGPNDVPPDYTRWLVVLTGLGLLGVGAVLVVRRRRRKSPEEPAKPPEKTLGE